jgi:hypothetical protein
MGPARLVPAAMVTHPGDVHRPHNSVPTNRPVDSAAANASMPAAAPDACMDPHVLPSHSKSAGIPAAAAPVAGSGDIWSKQAAVVQVSNAFCSRMTFIS